MPLSGMEAPDAPHRDFGWRVQRRSTPSRPGINCGLGVVGVIGEFGSVGLGFLAYSGFVELAVRVRGAWDGVSRPSAWDEIFARGTKVQAGFLVPAAPPVSDLLSITRFIARVS